MLWIVLFLVGLAQLVYVLFGYPLLLCVLARWRPKPVHSEPLTTSVSVIIPVLNGEQFIAEKLRSVLALDYPKNLIEVLIVSDGSTDATERIVETFATEGVRLLRVPRGGKPAALNAAIPITRGEILLLTDVRQILAPDSLQLLVNCFADPTVGVASGNLLIRHEAANGEASVELYWRYEMWIRARLSRIDSIFGAVGPLYAIRRDLTVPIPQDTLLDDVYLPLACFFRGYRLIVETDAHARDYPTTLKTEFRRKVRTLAGFYQIIKDYPALLGFHNRMWFHFVSYKVGRLLMPHAVLLVLISSFFLPEPLKWLSLAAQASFFALATLDPLIPQKVFVKALSSPIRTFAVFMIATVWGLQVLFASPRSLWKETRIAF